MRISYYSYYSYFSSLWYGEFTNEWKGNWAFKYTEDKVMLSGKVSCPHNDVDFNIELGKLQGQVTGTWSYDDEVAKFNNRYSLTAEPFK